MLLLKEAKRPVFSKRNLFGGVYVYISGGFESWITLLVNTGFSKNPEVKG